MENKFKQVSGYSLIIGSLLLIVAMTFHPSGGSIDNIVATKLSFMTSHSLAILSLPFVIFGFFGLSSALLTKSQISFLALFISFFGLIAAMIAGSINGFALPLFLSKVSEQKFNIETVTLIIRYGSYINISMDYISLSSISLSIAIWSALIIKNLKYLNWFGYYGVAIFLSFLLSAANGYNLAGLFLFRFVVFAIVSWIMIAAYKILIKPKQE
jgi:hypothetical protein